MKYSWENAAKAGLPMPDGLKQSEIKAFQAMALLTKRYKLGGISAEQAQRERKEIDKAFEHDAFCDKLNDWHVGLKKRIERAHNEYRKQRTIEAADRLSDVIDGFERSMNDG